MRAFLVAVAFLASLAAPANGDPKSDAMQVLEEWTKAFSASDVEGIVALYAPDALFVGTLSKSVVTKPDGIRKYFETALLNRRPRTATLEEHTAMVLSDSVVVVVGFDNVGGSRGRVTFVVARRGSEWKIVHFHRSAMP